MESDEGKLFIGGIAWDTTEETLNDYFSKYGAVSQTVIMRDKTTGRPRGFGFVVFSDPSVLDSVLQDRHTIEGRTVEAKRALSREEQQTSRPANNAGRSSGVTGNYRTKKIFVGGLPSTLTEDQFRQHFETYGDITDVVIMIDQTTNRPRGFGFISFDTEDAVDRVLQKTFHELNNKVVEVKRALPKDANPGGSGGGGRGGGYQGGNSGLYDSQMDGNRFMQQATGGGGYPAYSGYGQLGYGYGAGYGSYGGGGGGGYGGATAYGNSGYGNPGGLKPQWGGQSSGYGPNMGYGGGGQVAASMGQSGSGAFGYGGQGYGYGNDGNLGGYGGGGGRFGVGGGGGGGGGDQQAAGGGGGNMAGGYNGQTGYQ